LIPENELLFICARKNFQSEHQKAVFELCDKFEMKWNVVHLTALQHQIAPLIYSHLLRRIIWEKNINPALILSFIASNWLPFFRTVPSARA
jgi:hypothetical protein